MQCLVTHHPWVADDGYGASTFGASVSLRALVEKKQVPRKTANGEMIMSTAHLTFLDRIQPHGASGRSEPIDARDELHLPDGTTGPIIGVDGMLDADDNRPYVLEVWLG